MRDAKDPQWHDIWTLLIRYLGRHLHNDIQLANCMLKIIERSFRNPQDRLMSYDCWKILIDTYSNDVPHILNQKHIKLLMAPLKANLGNAEPVLLKRFEVWVYLIKSLKENAIMCLNVFLKFCFGTLVDNTMMFADQSAGKKSATLLKKATETLQELLGEL